MKLQEVIDIVAEEIAVVKKEAVAKKKQADADISYCSGATDALRRIVEILNSKEETPPTVDAEIVEPSNEK